MSAVMNQEKQQEIDEIFQHMEAAIRLNTYESHDFLFMVADLIPNNPTLAAALGKHAAEFIESPECPDTVEWTDIVVEAYRRALFDTVYSAKYGTDYMVRNLDGMRKFVNGYIRDHGMNVAVTGSSLPQ